MTVALLERLEALLAQGQDNALLRFSLGQACLNCGKQRQAVEHFAAALEHDPEYSAAWKLYGRALSDCDENAEAAAAYQNGIAVAEKKGDLQAAKEMRVFLKRLERDAG